MDKHIGRCPQLAEFYEAQENRKRMEKENKIKTIIYGDSTLALADPLGLRTEVVAMSGGSLGQVTQAAFNNPKSKDADNIILLGGANDLNNHAISQPEEFAENVSGTLSKICDLATENPEKQVIIVNSYPSIEERDEEFMLKEAILHKAVEELSDEVKEDVPRNISYATVAYETDETGHPTPQGTSDLLIQISQQVKTVEPLVWNTKFITSQKRYSRVQSVYRYGCSRCKEYGLKISRDKHHNPTLCDTCLEAVKDNAPNNSYTFLQKAKEFIEAKKKELAELEKDMEMSSESDIDDNANTKDNESTTDDDDGSTNPKKIKIDS